MKQSCNMDAHLHRRIITCDVYQQCSEHWVTRLMNVKVIASHQRRSTYGFRPSVPIP